ncbi:conserved hypothetical protein [Leishmania mexicana MHOM/GT/2001/U1103]|uniref:Uncharacterized protein n=1 Tax=Leishmania mexicana (strain MHOM/GT/2001/U1103) TaxID=929439 RepID=E9AMC7_LEIMU|nr:conserved hypothetical protein [Leishmania mexicana MHOM/GT/2001/U1103]CBZ24082.1 conserved hypothetical protein [Leishmania mexicana MHOM/GT/2001/U1103]
MAQLTKDEVHTYAEAMIAAIKTPAFQERVRAAMCREPTPADAEAVMKRYEEVQADYFTNHYISEAGGIRSSISAGAESSGTSGAGGRAKSSQDASEALAQEVDNMRLQKASDAPRLDGVEIVEQLKNAVRVYKEEETVRLITELCLLIESQVTTLPATVPALKHLYSNSVYGSSRMEHAQAGGGANVLPVTHPSPEMMQMNMAMRTLNPKQRETVERVQRAMMNGSPPLPEDMQDMLLIQRQLAAFMQTMQRFGQMPSGRGRGSGGRGGCGGRGAQ